MPAKPDISVIVPTWNNLEMLQLCVRSIRRHSQANVQIVVHVNERDDGTLDWVRQQGIAHSSTPGNVGVCTSLNLGFQQCRSDYIAYLNDDMYVLPGWETGLLERIRPFGSEQPCYVSGTMVQAAPISPRAVTADYGAAPATFDEGRLLADFHQGRLAYPDWNGATWPPCCIHRKWWDRIGGYSEALSPGFYSDIDFSMKLWQAGCRRFYGVGSSLVYHFSETTTSRVRGPKNRNVKQARLRFLAQWGILPSTFKNHFLQVDRPLMELLPTPIRQGGPWERTRTRVIGMLSSVTLRLDAA
jgi:GT2 family glycosyltransferase